MLLRAGMGLPTPVKALEKQPSLKAEAGGNQCQIQSRPREPFEAVGWNDSGTAHGSSLSLCVELAHCNEREAWAKAQVDAYDVELPGKGGAPK